MSSNIKMLCVYSLLDLCNSMPLDTITASKVISTSGISRHSFYKYFMDINDLICYVYDTKIVDLSYPYTELPRRYYDNLVYAFKNSYRFKNFMIPAVNMTNQNSLRDHMINQSSDRNMLFLKKTYGNDIPFMIHAAAEYHAIGLVGIWRTWINSGFPVSAEVLANTATNMRFALLQAVLKGEVPNVQAESQTF